MAAQRVGGVLLAKLNGQRIRVAGEWTYSLGTPKRQAKVGMDGVHGYIEEPQVPYVEGESTDRSELDVAALFNTTGATLVLELANGKVISFRDAWYAGDGTVKTKEGTIALRFEAVSADEG